MGFPLSPSIAKDPWSSVTDAGCVEKLGSYALCSILLEHHSYFGGKNKGV